jgi:hypothetical protein
VTEMRKTVGVVNRCSDVESVHPVNDNFSRKGAKKNSECVFLAPLRLCGKISVFSFYKCHCFGAGARVGTEAAEHC